VVFAILALAGFSFAQAEAENFRTRGGGDAQQSGATTISDVQAEIEFGQSIAARILGRYPMVDDSSLSGYVNLVGNAIVLHAGRPELTFRFAILETDNVNAYAAPGGYIFVTRGAMGLMRDEAELAGVLAHEVAHVTRKHIVNALNIRGSDSGTQAGLARFLSGAGDAGRVAFSQAVNKAVGILFEKGLAKEDELDADNTGTVYLATTGYDPTALKRYINRIKALESKRLSVMNSTHPSFQDRLKALSMQLASLGIDSGKFPTVTSRFNQYVKNN